MLVTALLIHYAIDCHFCLLAFCTACFFECTMFFEWNFSCTSDIWFIIV